MRAGKWRCEHAMRFSEFFAINYLLYIYIYMVGSDERAATRSGANLPARDAAVIIIVSE